MSEDCTKNNASVDAKTLAKKTPYELTANKSSRRDFLKSSIFAGGAVLLPGLIGSCNDFKPNDEPLTHLSLSDNQPIGGLDETFFIIADTHLGYPGTTKTNCELIDTLNAMPGKTMPLAFDGSATKKNPGESKIATPNGVLIAGDLTENGHMKEWIAFEKLYGLTGKEGRIKFPVFECTGNHDRTWYRNSVPKRVARRHKGCCYKVSWGDLQVISCDLCPGKKNIKWLEKQLEKIGPNLPIIIFFHYNMVGPFSDYWSKKEKRDFLKLCRYFKVIAVFHGHLHQAQIKNIYGLDVFNTGACKHNCNFFMVCRVTDNLVGVCTYFWGKGDRNKWIHNRLINYQTGEVLV